MRGKQMLILGLVLMLAGLKLVHEGVKEQRKFQGNELRSKMNSQGYYVVPK